MPLFGTKELKRKHSIIMTISLKEALAIIDRIDDELIKLIAERTKYTEIASFFIGIESEVVGEIAINKAKNKALENYDNSDISYILKTSDLVEKIYQEMNVYYTSKLEFRDFDEWEAEFSEFRQK